jgi:hypothetical protein
MWRILRDHFGKSVLSSLYAIEVRAAMGMPHAQVSGGENPRGVPKRGEQPAVDAAERYLRGGHVFATAQANEQELRDLRRRDARKMCVGAGSRP